MPTVAVFVMHQCKPGQREAVHAVWTKHMPTAVASNAGHRAYYYCYDSAGPDAVSAFQEYESPEAAKAFLSSLAYRNYVTEVEALLVGPPTVKSLVPVWKKQRQVE
jgi:quinol monooxygenase YgiN